MITIGETIVIAIVTIFGYVLIKTIFETIKDNNRVKEYLFIKE